MILKRIAVVACDAVGCLATCRAPLRRLHLRPETLPDGWIEKDGSHACPIHRMNLEGDAVTTQSKRSMLAVALLQHGWPENRLPRGWLKAEAQRIGMTIGYANQILGGWCRSPDFFSGFASYEARCYTDAEKAS